MVIEQDTNYAYKLKYISKPCFDDIRNLAVKFMRELPQQLQDELYEALNRGVDILDNEPLMVTYLYAFGKMHQAKLNFAFKQLPKKFFEIPQINIIDYGCGQAIGTMCYADFLRENGCSQKINTITLIEPSKLCLKRAALHVSVFFPDSEIRTVNNRFDDITRNDILCEENVPTLHILSNVLDMLCFDMDKFTKLINSCILGSNQFVCIGPYFGYYDKDARMEQFRSMLNGDEYYCNSFDKYELDEQKAWTAHILCFEVRKLIDDDLSTEVTKTDIDNGVEDEFGVLYSKDGKRLLQCRNYQIESCSIKGGIYVICKEAFEECSSIKEIVIPNTVMAFGKGAFLRCFSLQRINIPDSVIEIADGTFANCHSLIQINIPNSVVSIGKNAFAGCSSLQQISMSNSIAKITDYTFWNCSSIQQIILPNSIKSIGESAFRGCKNLRHITMPGSITTIECKAFFECSSLQAIDIPNSVTNIGALAFGGCSSLQQITLSDSVTIIGDSAFRGCSLLKQIIISDSVTGIGEWAFCGCSSLQQITLPDSIINIGVSAFYSCKNLQHINIPNTITTLESGTFMGCSSLKEITIPNSVTEIGDVVFDECLSLLQITIPCSVTKIGEEAFGKCKSLQQISINNAHVVIGRNILWGCDSLQQISIPKGSTEKFKKMLDEVLWDKLVEQ